MQSIVVYSSRYGSVTTSKPTSNLAINLLKTLLNQYTNKTNFIHEKTNGVLNKLKFLLSHSLTNGSNSKQLFFNLHQPQQNTKLPFFLFGNSFLSNLFSNSYEMPFLALDLEQLSITKRLHLITAYSGYSKDYLNDNYKTNIRTTRIRFASSDSHKIGNLGCNKKGLIGDDAWFIAKQSYADVLGVADGVGGWHEYGIDPSKFSFNLMKTCKRLVEQNHDLAINNTTPINLLEQSYKTLLESKNNSLLIGSSTACILVFHHDTNFLHTCNLGDSGFCIIRNNKIIHKSQEQQHYFNSPYQIAILPNLNTTYNNNNNNNNNNNVEMTNRNVEPLENSENLLNDSPESAATSSIQLNEGDFILVATDGLWDNLAESQLLLEISKIKSYLIEDLEKAANNLARKAIELALDPDYISPFAKAARKYGINISGGKPDDITVLLARVSK